MNTTYLIAILCAPLWIALWKAIGFSLVWLQWDTFCGIKALCYYSMGIDSQGSSRSGLAQFIQQEHINCCNERATLWRS